MDITNKTKRPLRVPLPGGKKLFLQPGKTGQVTPKALKHPPLVELLETGDLECAESEHGPNAHAGGKASGPAADSPGHKGASGAARQSGDR